MSAKKSLTSARCPHSIYSVYYQNKESFTDKRINWRYEKIAIMNSQLPQENKLRHQLRSLGPGLLFASTAIGTSHLVLSTRAGAHHGMIYLVIILAAMILKYPLYEFGTRYTNATGHSLLKGYKDQGTWAISLFLLIIFINMFAVTAAIAAVSAGILSSMFSVTAISVPVLAGLIILVTVLLLLGGGYSGLDKLIKFISCILLLTVLTAFFAVIIKGPIEPITDFKPNPILEGAGLTLLISLLGWMPSGLEASTMNSIWVLEKIKSEKYHPTLKESLFDFNLGYLFTTILAVLFLTIGAYTSYGSGQTLDGSATAFSNKLLNLFTTNLGQWSYSIFAIAAFGTIYGTLITVMDGFPRGFSRAIRLFKYKDINNSEVQEIFLNRSYKIILIIVGIGGFLLFYLSASSMIQILEFATVISFIFGPIIGFINLKAIQSDAVPQSHRPPGWMIGLAYLGLVFMVGFAAYYLVMIVAN